MSGLRLLVLLIQAGIFTDTACNAYNTHILEPTTNVDSKTSSPIFTQRDAFYDRDYFPELRNKGKSIDQYIGRLKKSIRPNPVTESRKLNHVKRSWRATSKFTGLVVGATKDSNLKQSVRDTLKQLEDSIWGLQSQVTRVFDDKKQDHATILGTFPSTVRTNFHGTAPQIDLRQNPAYGIPDLNSLTTLMILHCFAEATVYGSNPRPSVTNMSAAIQALESFGAHAYSRGSSIMTIWPEKLLNDRKGWVNSPENIRLTKIKDGTTLGQVQSLVKTCNCEPAKSGLSAITQNELCEQHYDTPLGDQLYDLATPADFMTSFANLALGSLFLARNSEPKNGGVDLYTTESELWLPTNENFPQLIQKLKDMVIILYEKEEPKNKTVSSNTTGAESNSHAISSGNSPSSGANSNTSGPVSVSTVKPVVHPTAAQDTGIQSTGQRGSGTNGNTTHVQIAGQGGTNNTSDSTHRNSTHSSSVESTANVTTTSATIKREENSSIISSTIEPYTENVTSSIEKTIAYNKSNLSGAKTNSVSNRTSDSGERSRYNATFNEKNDAPTNETGNRRVNTRSDNGVKSPGGIAFVKGTSAVQNNSATVVTEINEHGDHRTRANSSLTVPLSTTASAATVTSSAALSTNNIISTTTATPVNTTATATAGTTVATAVQYKKKSVNQILSSESYFALRNYLDEVIPQKKHDVILIPALISDNVHADNKTTTANNKDATISQNDGNIWHNGQIYHNYNHVDLLTTATTVYSLVVSSMTGMVNAQRDVALQKIMVSSLRLLTWYVSHPADLESMVAVSNFPSRFQLYWMLSRIAFQLNSKQARQAQAFQFANEVVPDFIAALRKNMTYAILKSITDGGLGEDGKMRVYIDDIIGVADLDDKGNKKISGHDRLFTSAMATNALIATWTTLENGALKFAEGIADDVRIAVNSLVNYISSSVADPNNPDTCIFWSEQVKNCQMFPAWYPSNTITSRDGAEVTPTKPDNALRYGVKGYIPKPDYQHKLEHPVFLQKNLGNSLPDLNSLTSYFRFWSSPAYTKAISLLAIAQAANLQVDGA